MCQVYVTRGAFIYLFSSLLELYSRRKKLQKKRNKRFLPLLSYFQKLSDNLQASPPFFPRLGSRLCFSSLFFFFFFYPTFKLRRRKKEVLELEERSTYVISSRKLLTGPTKEAECAQTKLRFVHAPYEEKIFIQREVYFRCNTIFACYFHVQITCGAEERKNFYFRQ